MNAQSKLSEKVRSAFGLLLVLAPFAVGLGSLGRQIFLWLRDGRWTSVSVLDLLSWSGVGSQDWIARPNEWIGVWKLLNWLPLSAASLVVGIVLVLAALSDSQ